MLRNEINKKEFLNLYKNDKEKGKKLYKSLEDLCNKNPNTDVYNHLNTLTNGKGLNIIRALNYNRLHSVEYISFIKSIKDKKRFDVTTPQGLVTHIYRNKNQYGKAPRDLNYMLKFVKLGYFICEGYSPSHNIDPNNNTYDSRKQSVSDIIYCYRNKLLDKPNKFAKLDNMSFRGTPGSQFEGCQFVYNSKTKQLITDNINRGTFDYGKFGTITHFVLDVLPWLDIGNGNNEETADLFFMDPIEETMLLKNNIKFITKELEMNGVELQRKVNEIYKFIINREKFTKNGTESLTENSVSDSLISKHDIYTQYANKYCHLIESECKSDYDKLFTLIHEINEKTIFDTIQNKILFTEVKSKCGQIITNLEHSTYAHTLLTHSLTQEDDVKAGESRLIHTKLFINTEFNESVISDIILHDTHTKEKYYLNLTKTIENILNEKYKDSFQFEVDNIDVKNNIFSMIIRQYHTIGEQEAALINAGHRFHYDYKSGIMKEYDSELIPLQNGLI